MGVAVDPVHIPLDSPALRTLVRANQRALGTIAEKPSTPDGQVDLNIAQQRFDAVQPIPNR